MYLHIYLRTQVPPAIVTQMIQDEQTETSCIIRWNPPCSIIVQLNNQTPLLYCLLFQAFKSIVKIISYERTFRTLYIIEDKNVK